MAKTKISEYDSTAANNTDIDSINIDEGCAPSGINNAIREVMAHLKDWQSGSSGDALAVAGGGTGSTTASGARTNLGLGTIATQDATSVNIDGGAIDGTTIGGSSAAAGTFTTATATTGNITTLNATTVDSTNVEVTNLKAKDGTAAATIADTTGVITIPSSVLTTTDINGGSIDGTAIGASSASTGAFTSITGTSGVISANSSSDALRITQTGSGNVLLVEDSSNPDSSPFVIDATGTVVVGDTNAISGVDPAVLGDEPILQIAQNSTQNHGQGIYRFANSVYGSDLTFAKSRSSTVGTNTIVQDDDQIGKIQFNGGTGILYSTAASIESYVDGTPVGSGLTNRVPGDLRFSTTADGASSPTEHLRIKNTGESWFQANNSTAAVTITQTGTGNALVVEDSANPDSTPFVVNQSGFVGIGTNAPVSPLDISGDGFNSSPFFRAYGASAGAYPTIVRGQGTQASPQIIQNGNAIGGLVFSGYDGANNISAALIRADVDGTPGTNDMPGRLVFSTTPDGGSSPVEAVRIDNQGRVGIGGASAPFAKLQVIGTLPSSSAFSYGISSAGTIPSTTTTGYIGFDSAASTQATSFTLTNLTHFQAYTTLGAGSAVTNQYGFAATSSLTGATNNYGFYSNIASGTGRYNFYAAGSAANYFAGSVGIGIVPTTRFEVADASRYSFNVSASASYTLTTSLNPAGSAFVDDIRNALSHRLQCSGVAKFILDSNGNIIENVNTSVPTLSTNNTMVFNLTSDTNLRVSVRGSDGVTRTANITLS